MNSHPSTAMPALLLPLGGFLAFFLAFVSPWWLVVSVGCYALAFLRMALALARL